MELFPFDKKRDGQRRFMEDIKKCLSDSGHLVADAPIGIGKTAATLAPCLEYALENSKTVVFLTPKHSQHRIAIETLKNIRNKFGVEFTVADIIGKKWMCPVPDIQMLSTQDFNDYCGSVRRDEKCIFYNNTKNKDGMTKKAADVFAEICSSGPLHAEEIKFFCKGMCPYEMALEAAKKSNVIICDYYHIFSHIGKGFLYRIGKDMKDLILIVDEAHNLPERVRKVLSGKITSKSLSYAQKEAMTFGFEETASNVRRIANAMKGMTAGMKERKEVFVSREDFMDHVCEIGEYDDVIHDIESAATEVRESRKKSSLGALSRFLTLWAGEDEGYARILRKFSVDGKTFASLSYNCLDPMLITKDIADDAHSMILMSGTLSPMKMYKNLLGLGENTMCQKYESCFPQSNRLNIVIPDITTKYSARSEKNSVKIADYISRICSSFSGNAAVFFPSYEMRDEIMMLAAGMIKKNVMKEKPELTKEEKAKMFNAFMNSKDTLLSGTQAGSFSEGVDYFGNVLKCVMIVGVSLSHPDLETQALINYYDRKFQRGWEYGYIYPAVHRAMQSAGRCIRTEKDRAVAVFMDSRFLWKNYRAVFPVDMKFEVTTEPEKEIREFFDAKK